MLRKSASGRSTGSFLVVLVSHVRHLLVAALLSGAVSADVTDVTPLKRITAFVGEVVILPCTIPLVDDDVPTVEWSKEGLSPSFAFLYRDGCETFDGKNPVFQYRTSLIMTELKNGNLSLRISNLQLSDMGTYRCKVVQGKEPKDVASLDLVVVSEPKLTVAPNDAGKLTLRCEVECWVPEPEIAFFDDQGKEITAEKPERAQHSGQCFSITRRATLQASTSRVTCRVRQLQSDLIRSAEIHVADACMISLTATIAISVTVTLLVMLVFICIWRGCASKKRGYSVGGQPACQTTVYRIQNDSAENTALLKEMENLRSTLKDKEEEIHCLNANLIELASKQNPVSQHHRSANNTRFTELVNPSSQHHSKPGATSTWSHSNFPELKHPKEAVSMQNPAPGPQVKRHKSTPALLINSGAVSFSFAPACPSGQINISRSMSMSHPRPNAAKLQRRNTMFGNRYEVLTDLPEEY